MEFKIDLVNILILFILLINSVYGLIVYSRNRKDRINFSFFALTITISLWELTMFGYRGFLDHDLAIVMARLLYFSAICIPVTFLFFCFIFPDPNTHLTKYQKFLVPIPPILLGILALYPSLFIADVILLPGKESHIIFNNLSHILFGLYVVIYFSWAYSVIYKKYKKAQGVGRVELGYVFVGTFGSTMITLVTNLGLLYFGNFQFNWVGQIGIIFMISLIFYSILKFKLFNIKVIATELLTFILWVSLLVRFFLSDSTQDKVINIILLLLTVIIGIFLIRSVIREVRQREKIELLAADLEKANKKLVQLDKQKSEFVSFATHQLRAPLTAMKGYASLILEGEMGTIQPQTKEAVERIFESSNTLASIVDDYLNITRIELGTMKYAFETVSFRALIEDVIAEIKPNIDKVKTIKFSFTVDTEGHDFRIIADRDKLKQVIVNLIDNSLKYTPKGTIHVSLDFDRARHLYVFKVTDTGIGIAPEILPHLFSKFTRAGNANKTNIKGTGLGLFVAKEMVAAHQGTIRAESAGEGKGSSFIVELEPFSRI